MLNTYIVAVVDTLLPAELEAFKLFLESPFFNRGFNAEKLKLLFILIVEAQQPPSPEKLEKNIVYQKLFPNSPLVEGKLDKLISELKKQLQTFLAIQQYQSAENDGRRILDVLTVLRQRGLEDKYFPLLEKIKKQTENEQEETLENYRLQLSVSLEEHEWESTYNKARGDLSIPAVINTLDKYYYTERTIMLNLLLLQQKLTILPPSSLEPLAEKWVIPESVEGKSILLHISWKIHELLRLQNPPIEQFQELLNLLKINESRVGKASLAGYYAHIRNYCSILIDNGHNDFRIILHKIHRDNLARGYFYFEGQIPSNAYLNITQIALMIGEQQWAKTFVEEHKNLIIGDNETNDFYLMNKALCFFDEKKYEDALKIIPFGSTYSFYHLMVRRVELKIYYELNSDLLPYKIDAFKMFISRAGNKVLSESLHELFVNFINFLRQLSLSPKIKDKSRAEKMITRINEKKLVAERSWLLEKARELGERRK